MVLYSYNADMFFKKKLAWFASLPRALFYIDAFKMAAFLHFLPQQTKKKSNKSIYLYSDYR